MTGSRDPSRDALDRASASALASLVARVREGGLDQVGGNAGGPQAAHDGPSPRSLLAERVLGDLPREGFVVDQAHPLEAFEYVRHLVRFEPGLEQTPLQLPPAASSHGQQAQGALVAALRGLGLA